MKATQAKCIVPSCPAPASDLIKVALCGNHAIAVHREMSEILADRVTNSVRMAVGKPNRARPQAGQRSGLVYFMRFGDLIKIGFTSDLRRRVTSLQPDEILGTMLGTLHDEQALHARFGPTWVRGELFARSPELEAFIHDLQATA